MKMTCGARDRSEERSLPAAGRLHPLPRAPFAKSLRAGMMTAKRRQREDTCFWLAGAFGALLRRAVGSNVVVEADAQIEVRAFELRRKRLEGAGGANRGSRGGIQRLFARRPINAEAFGGKTSIVIDAERNRDDSLISQIKGFRHHRNPILFQLREQPVDVTLENPPLRSE